MLAAVIAVPAQFDPWTPLIQISPFPATKIPAPLRPGVLVFPQPASVPEALMIPTPELFAVSGFVLNSVYHVPVVLREVDLTPTALL